MEQMITGTLIDYCIACLKKNENMLDLSKNRQDSEEIRTVILNIFNFEWSYNKPFPSYLCHHCKDNLLTTRDFYNMFKNSISFIEQYVDKHNLNNIQHEEDILIKNEDLENDTYNIQHEDILVKNDDEYDSDYEESLLITNQKYKKIRKKKLEAIPLEEIRQAIEEFKNKLNEHKVCIICGYSAESGKSLAIHMHHLHKDIKTTWCSICNQIVENLADHSYLHPKKILCTFCSNTINKSHFIEHLKSHDGSRPFQCEICNMRFVSSRCLRIHNRLHTNERPYKCPNCDKSFIQIGSLKYHVQKRHGSETCDNCKKYFETKEMIESHECTFVNKAEELSGDKNFESGGGDKDETNNLNRFFHNFCKECNRKVRSLTKHIEQFHKPEVQEASDENQEDFTCSVCQKQLKSSNKLRQHMKLHTGNLPYKCNYCGKGMSSRSRLVDHERIHTGEKPNMCNVCGKGFAQASALRTHMRQHTGRPDVCKICEKSFCRPSELKIHMRKHTGEKPFLCTECGKRFLQKSHLTEHVKTHSTERPYQCNYCTLAFKHKSLLNSHIQIHNGNKKYKCNICPYACYKMYRLNQHMKQHSAEVPIEKPHICQICEKAFATVALLNAHMGCVHNAVV